MGKAKLAEMVKADGKPEGFPRGLWKQANGPREGGSGSWSVSLSTLKDFVKTQVLLARKSVDVGGPGARSLPMNLHVQVRDIQHPPRTTPTRSSAVVSDPFVFGRLYVTGANGAGGHVIP